MDRQGRAHGRWKQLSAPDARCGRLPSTPGRPVTQGEVIDRLFASGWNYRNDPLDPGFGFDLIRSVRKPPEIVVQHQRTSM